MITLSEAALSKVGLYTPGEAALYARMPAQTLVRWFFQYGDHAPLRESQISIEGERFIGFWDFAEALAIRTLRTEHNIPLPKIREAIDEAYQRYGVKYPFAQKNHKTYRAGREICIALDGEEDPIQLTGKGKTQQHFQVVLENYLKDLEFDEEGMARLYTAFRFNEKKIIMCPNFNFGEPVLEGSAYTAETLWQAAVSEGSVEKAAKLYEVQPEEVEAAYRYYDSILKPKAA